MYVSIDRVQGRGREGARLEAHRRYIDIQLTIDGLEEIGWKPIGDCVSTSEAFDAAKDITFFNDRPESWLSVPAGRFAIFFPEDAHAPLGGRGILEKGNREDRCRLVGCLTGANPPWHARPKAHDSVRS